jgi:hypothetical protein
MSWRVRDQHSKAGTGIKSPPESGDWRHVDIRT